MGLSTTYIKWSAGNCSGGTFYGGQKTFNRFRDREQMNAWFERDVHNKVNSIINKRIYAV